jgi:hypothetical protein
VIIIHLKLKKSLIGIKIILCFAYFTVLLTFSIQFIVHYLISMSNTLLYIVDIHCVKNVFQKSNSHSIVENVMLKLRMVSRKLKNQLSLNPFLTPILTNYSKFLIKILKFIIIELKRKLNYSEYF